MWKLFGVATQFEIGLISFLKLADILGEATLFLVFKQNPLFYKGEHYSLRLPELNLVFVETEFLNISLLESI